jgi:hypothetical protein
MRVTNATPPGIVRDNAMYRITPTNATPRSDIAVRFIFSVEIRIYVPMKMIRTATGTF